MNSYFEKYNFFNDFEDIDEFKEEDNNNEYIIYFISGFILGIISSLKL